MFYSAGRNVTQRILLTAIVVALDLSAPFHVPAQSGGGVDQIGTGGRHSIQGRIYFPSGRRSDVRVKVRLENFSAGELSVLSDANGSFSFRGLEPGSYTVVVDAGADYQIARESVYVDTDGITPRRGGMTLPPVSRIYTVQVNLQLRNDPSVKATVIDAALAAVPDKAQDLYRKALESAQNGDSNKAIEQLNEALSVFPDFPLALNQLGVQYLKKGQPDKAADALKRAIKLTPQEFQPLLNYGISLLNMKRFAEAEEQLRASIKVNSSVPTAHMYLGIALSVQRKLDEGQTELESSLKSNSQEVALAHRYLAGIFLERREYDRAADQLEIYLKLVPKAADFDLLKRKAHELREKKSNNE